MKTFSFSGTGAEYFKIWIVNILLTIVTLGLYYPWAKVRNNRYLYGNSQLATRNFDYHATGKQLFMGYLIAMGILILFTIIQKIFPTGSLILMLIIFLGFPWLIWQSLRFNMRMTSFSNVRFGFNGRLGQSYINFLLLPIAGFIAVYLPFILIGIFAAMSAQSGLSGGTMVLIAIAVPLTFVVGLYVYAFLKKRNSSYLIGGIQYGQGQFETQLETKAFAKIALKTVGLSLLATIILMVGFSVILMLAGLGGSLLSLSNSIQDPAAMQGLMEGGLLLTVIVPFYLGFIFVSFLVIAYSYSRQRQYIFNNTKLDGSIEFASSIKARKMSWIMATNFLAVILSLGLAYPWAKVRMVRYVLENSLIDINMEDGLDSYITQQEEKQSSLGDQIGDALDIDVGLGL